MSIYGLLDRFLPFDEYLDPRFGPKPSGPMQPHQGAGMAAQGPAQAGRIPRLPGPQMPSTPAPSATPRPPALLGGPPERAMNPTMGFPAVPAARPQQPAPAPVQAPRKGSPVSFGRTFADVLFKGVSPYDSMDAQRATPDRRAAAEEFKRNVQAYLATLPPDQRPGVALAIAANPGKWAESFSKGAEPQVVAAGSSVYKDGQFARSPLSPVTVQPGGAVFDPASRETLYQAPFKPEIVTTSPGETATRVDLGGGNPRSPEVGQFIFGQLQDIPGLKLGNPGPRSEAEIAALPLSAPNTFHREGAALDFTAPGLDPQQVIGTVKARMGPGYDVIYHPENGSFHVEPGPDWQPPSGSRVVAAGGAKPQYRPASPQEKAAAGLDPSVPAQIGPDGKLEPITSPTAKPMPAALQKAEDEDLEAIGIASGINNQLQGYLGQIADGSLNFGPISNFTARAGLMTGTADAKAINFGSFRAGLEKLRNDSLRLNNGVQTEGDAKRAWNELFANINDEGFVKQRLAEIIALNERAIELKKARLQLRRERSRQPGFEEGELGDFTPPRPSGVSAQPPPRKPASGARILSVRPAGGG